MGNKFGLAYETYTFEDLLIIENLNKRLLYSNFKEEIINLKSDFESQSFLNKLLKLKDQKLLLKS